MDYHSESEESTGQAVELPATIQSLTSEGFTVDPNGDEGWNAVVRRLCEFLKLPGALRYRSVWEAHN